MKAEIFEVFPFVNGVVKMFISGVDAEHPSIEYRIQVEPVPPTVHVDSKPVEQQHPGKVVSLELDQLEGMVRALTRARNRGRELSSPRKDRDDLRGIELAWLKDSIGHVAEDADSLLAALPSASEVSRLSDLKASTNEFSAKFKERRYQPIREQLLGNTSDEKARAWWFRFEAENQDRLELVIRVAEELRLRSATLDEYYDAYVHAKSNNLQAVFHYLDFLREKQQEQAQAGAPTHVSLEKQAIEPPPSQFNRFYTSIHALRDQVWRWWEHQVRRYYPGSEVRRFCDELERKNKELEFGYSLAVWCDSESLPAIQHYFKYLALAERAPIAKRVQVPNELAWRVEALSRDQEQVKWFRIEQLQKEGYIDYKARPKVLPGLDLPKPYKMYMGWCWTCDDFTEHGKQCARCSGQLEERKEANAVFCESVSSWCEALRHFWWEPSHAFAQQVILSSLSKELKQAIESHCIFDGVEISSNLASALQVHPTDIATFLLAALPKYKDLGPGARHTFLQIVGRFETEWGLGSKILGISGGCFRKKR